MKFSASLLGLLLMASLSTPASGANFIARIKEVSPPETAPSLVFKDADNIQHTLADYHGRYVLLNIWASWCGPCVEEMPSLDNLQQTLSTQKLVIIPLSEDRGEAIVSAFYQRHALKHLPIALDSAGVAPSFFKLDGLPTTLLIDPQGQIIDRFEGEADWSSPAALAFFNSVIH